MTGRQSNTVKAAFATTGKALHLIMLPSDYHPEIS